MAKKKYGEGLKSDVQIAKELNKIPISTKPKKPEPKTNRVCSCGRKIGDDDTYFIRVEPQELPEIFCEFCVDIL